MVDFAAERARMVARQLRARGIADERVLDAMGAVPRERFVDGELTAHAYDDGPLPIGQGQTISQPYIVALMAELAAVGADDRVLEVGSGCGYMAAVLARLAARVVGIERHGGLARRARGHLEALGVDNAVIVEGDGTRGYAPQAPFDAIVVSAAAPRRPDALVAQLAPGGRLVAPVGERFGQVLERVVKRGDGTLDRSEHGMVAFVPLVAGG